MNKAVKVSILSILILSIFLGFGYWRVTSPIKTTAYSDPSLLVIDGSEANVIVTAADSKQAAQIVQSYGGKVSTDLWIIHAVSAVIPAAQLKALAADPGVVSIVNNHPVTSADAPDWSGRVTNRRRINASFTLDGVAVARAAFLPDGGFVSVSENGKGIISNADGNERARFNLGVNAFVFDPLIGPDGSIYLTRMEKDIFSINLDGSIRWRYTNPLRFLTPAALGPDGNLYAFDEKNHLVVLQPGSGQVLLRKRFGDDSWGSAQTGFVIAPDGTLINISKNDPSRVYAVSPAGNLLWMFVGERGKPLNFSPILSANGGLYTASTEKKIYALNAANGSLINTFSPAMKITTQPVLGPGGSLYMTLDDDSLAGYRPDGSLQFTFHPAGLAFKTSPVIGADTLFIAAEQKVLLAVDPLTGQERWRYSLLGNIRSSPILDLNGNVLVGSEGKDFIILDENKNLVSRLILEDKITQSARINAGGDVLIRVGDHKLTELSMLATSWRGGPDVEPSDIRREWALSYPVTIDIGADQVQDSGITGQGVTIAVVDSGVYFNKHVEDILGADLDRQFLGQADFVGNGVCAGAGQQKSGYCLSDHHNSIDAYGHGSHVAGIIWSRIIDQDTEVKMGVAPDANIFSVRVLDNIGQGTYADVIEGIQFVVANRSLYNIRVMNLSISANPLTPYFADPFNRAVEAAWASGIVVVAAAGNAGPAAQTITVPGNDPYVITVGALNGKRTAGYWWDDQLSSYSASGPTLDGFIKPDVLAPGSNIVSFMYTDKNDARCARLAISHPEFNHTMSLFRMSGTSMSAGVTSGVVALILQSKPDLTPDQVKYRLKASAQPTGDELSQAAYNTLQQGAGRIWAPQAVFGEFPGNPGDNDGMDIQTDLENGWENAHQLDSHYFGPVVRMPSDDGQFLLYAIRQNDESLTPLGVTPIDSLAWLPSLSDAPIRITWNNGQIQWSQSTNQPAGNWTWGGGNWTWGGGNWTWGGGNWTWGGGNWTWGGGNWTWGGGNWTWGGSSPDLLIKDLSTDNVANTTWVVED